VIVYFGFGAASYQNRDILGSTITGTGAPNAIIPAH
jgi:hypothetical protein